MLATSASAGAFAKATQAPKNAHWSDRVATTAVTMQRRLSASWAEAQPRSPQGSLNAPSGVGQFAPVPLGREDARTGEDHSSRIIVLRFRAVAVSADAVGWLS